MKWQPIETAPRDGTEILVCANVTWWGWRYETANWIRNRGWECGFEPTHWLLLEPPEPVDYSCKKE